MSVGWRVSPAPQHLREPTYACEETWRKRIEGRRPGRDDDEDSEITGKERPHPCSVRAPPSRLLQAPHVEVAGPGVLSMGRRAEQSR
ncbi:hypothetical protein O3P69_010104 [Scylla paramamosain]|uniref:Uncharacterized protein n=1 Tax=Scylla paramamosain TaxID=85552 RepID=A0AAW0SQ36_SCYPA